MITNEHHRITTPFANNCNILFMYSPCCIFHCFRLNVVHVFHWQVTYTIKVHRGIFLFVCFCLIIQDLSWETVVSASVLVHRLALIKFYVFYISQSFVIRSLSFGILSLIMFCSCHYMPCLYMPHMWAENS